MSLILGGGRQERFFFFFRNNPNPPQVIFYICSYKYIKNIYFFSFFRRFIAFFYPNFKSAIRHPRSIVVSKLQTFKVRVLLLTGGCTLHDNKRRVKSCRFFTLYSVVITNCRFNEIIRMENCVWLLLTPVSHSEINYFYF